MKGQEHPLSWHALLRVSILIIAAFLVWKLSFIFIILLLSLMLTSAIHPLIQLLDKRLPVILSTVIVISFLFLPIIVLAMTILPIFVEQFPNLLKTIDSILQQSAVVPDAVKRIDLTQYMQSTGTYILTSTAIVTSFLVKFFSVIFLTLYISIDLPRLYWLFLHIVPVEKKETVDTLIKRLAKINGDYVRGVLLIAFVCGVVITTGLLLLGVPYAIPLGILAGLFDLLPFIGIFVSAVPAIIIAFSVSPLTGFLVLGLFFLYQQIEANILAPSIYKKILNIPPAISFLSLLVGVTLFGIPGAFFALPVATSIPLLLSFIKEEEKKERKNK